MNSAEDKAPREFQSPGEYKKKGLILVHTGDGKGKTTAAIGTAFRAIGRGFHVAMVQFIKGTWKTGELEAVKHVSNQFQIYPMGEGFTWDTKDYAKDVQTARRTWAKCVEVLHDQDHRLVIFDEINYCFQYNFLDVKEVIQELQKKPQDKHVILTGRGAPSELIEIADLVTEMKCIKHPYQQGLKAQPGIEY